MRENKLLRAAITAAFAVACLSNGVPAAAGGAGGGSTELTQLLNNFQLLDIAAKEAVQVAEAVQRRLLLVQQYVTMVQNLKNLPQALLEEALAPYRQQIETLGRAYQSVVSLKNSADTARNLFNRRLAEAGSMNMNVADYMRHEAVLATQRGGIYRQRMQQDLAAIDQLQARATALRSVAQQTNRIAGNIEGLQVLAQHASISAGELMEIKGVLLAQSADRNAQSALKQEAHSVKSDTLARTLNEAKAQKDKRDAQSLPESNPWGRTWPGMSP